jgi:hypothetical protein
MEQTHKEVIENNEIKHVLRAFIDAVECVPRGICEPDAVDMSVSKRYVVAFVGGGEVRLDRDGKSVFAQVRTGNYKLLTTKWDMFVLRGNRQIVYTRCRR